MRSVALALAFGASASALVAPRPPKVASALSAAAKVPGANQRVKNTYDLKTIERTLATERDACAQLGGARGTCFCDCFEIVCLYATCLTMVMLGSK